MIGIVRAHLEEDAAKTVHVGGRTGRIGGADYSLVDYNRGGTPLVEIVTAPDLHSAEDAKRFLQLLRQTIVELGISDAEMEKGTLRVDANVSVRPAGSDELRTRCEIKNMNSFTHIASGIDAEIAAADRGLGVGRRGRAAHLRLRRRHRRADAAADEGGGRRLPLLPRARSRPGRAAGGARRAAAGGAARAARRRGSAGSRETLDLDRALVLVTGGLDALWEATVAAGADGVAAANVIANKLVGAGVDPAAVDPRRAREAGRGARADPAQGVRRGDRAASASPASRADPYLAQEAVSDTAALEPIVDAILAANPAQVAAYRGGKDGLLGFFVGQVMKETRARPTPARRQRARAREALRLTTRLWTDRHAIGTRPP